MCWKTNVGYVCAISEKFVNIVDLSIIRNSKLVLYLASSRMLMQVDNFFYN